jgi:hypothetical protein
MIRKQLMLKDPLKQLILKTDAGASGEFCAVVARPGVGKTAFLVQVALSAMLTGKKVLHISVQDPVDKVNLWYVELFQKIASSLITNPQNGLWEELLTQRFIMTFETESFRFDKLEQRITELKEKTVFVPDIVIVDGLSVDTIFEELGRLKMFAAANAMTFWFSVGRTRESSAALNITEEFGENFNALFDVVFWMVPEKNRILVKRHDDRQNITQHRPAICLDPSTMLVQEYNSQPIT